MSEQPASVPAPKLADFLMSKTPESVAEFKTAIQNTGEDLESLKREMAGNPEGLKLTDQERANLSEAIAQLERERTNDHLITGIDSRLTRIKDIFGLQAAAPANQPTGAPTQPTTSPAATPTTQNNPLLPNDKRAALVEQLKGGKGIDQMINNVIAGPLTILIKQFKLERFMGGIDLERTLWTAVRDLNIPLLNLPILGKKLKEQAAARVEISEKKTIILGHIASIQSGFPRIELTGTEELLLVDASTLTAERIREVAQRKRNASPQAQTLQITVADLRGLEQARTQEEQAARQRQENERQDVINQKKVAALAAFGFTTEDMAAGRVTLTQGQAASVDRGQPVAITLTSAEFSVASGPDAVLAKAFANLSAAKRITVADTDGGQPVLTKNASGIEVTVPSTGIENETASALNAVAQKMTDAIAKIDYSQRVPPADSGVRFLHANGTLILSQGIATLRTIAASGVPPQINEVRKDTDYAFKNGKWEEVSSAA